MTQWRPPLPRRWYLYCAIAYLAPPLILMTVAQEEVPYRDVIWLITLVPAYLLSYQYGMRGAVAGLTMGTVLFTAIQFLAAWHLSPADWRVTVPIYASYGIIAISVGWLTEQLHGYYDRAIAGERAEAVRQIAITLQHEVNNALAMIQAEAQLLPRGGETEQAADVIRVQAGRIHELLQQLAALTRAPTTDYVAGVRMIDVTAARGAPPPR